MGVSALIYSVLYLVATCSDPGYVKGHFDFLELLKEVHPCELCPDCYILRSTRSRHCPICNKCVERYDHHCPWLNNCVGVGNHNSYLCFLYALIVLFFLMIASSVLSLF